ncbi:hypothetical protein GALMADRAFT_217241 [Galerina marginata CBS 339.88]|uniref:Uncharacterized protein n=1 Tax=Galerina marginata (strain CBS 339.88) TaxID=685588 RepID=A0A067S5G1_GALM3|nr:hypothetical protein GALMADRAFT_217241 [Galerina marginata CBS 339.88]
MKLAYLITVFAAIITSHQVAAVACTSSVTCRSLGCSNGGHVCETATCQNGVCVGLVCARAGMLCPIMETRLVACELEKTGLTLQCTWNWAESLGRQDSYAKIYRWHERFWVTLILRSYIDERVTNGSITFYLSHSGSWRTISIIRFGGEIGPFEAGSKNPRCEMEVRKPDDELSKGFKRYKTSVKPHYSLPTQHIPQTSLINHPPNLKPS